MKLTQNEVKRLRSWKEHEVFERDKEGPMLPRVCFSIVSRHAHKAKTAKVKLRRARQCIDLVLNVLRERGGA
jgi:hypothetical protein